MLLDAAGGMVVDYTVDAWGRVYAIDGSMADTLGILNPLIYRGYVYDHETGLYYLNSRYYDPKVGRFLNADAFVATGQGLIGNNMFAYCNNNPVMLFDPSGTAAMVAFGSSTNILEQPWKSGGGGSTNYNGGCSTLKPAGSSPQKVPSVWEYITNASEQVVLDAEHVAFYKGVPIIKADLGNGGAASFGIIMDDSYVNNPYGVNVVKHEYGHVLHLASIGMGDCLVKAAIPSLIGAGLTKAGILDNKYYYDLPWEYTANMYGGASFGSYLPWTETVGGVYLLWTILAW